MRPWEELPEDLRRSNLAQAADIGVKCDAIGCAVIPESATAPDFAFTAGEIQRLAQMEHQRWVKERQEQGFVHGPNRQGNQHPDLVEWQYLSEAAKDKDRDAIRELPAILRQAGFQILRLPPRSLWPPASSGLEPGPGASGHPPDEQADVCRPPDREPASGDLRAAGVPRQGRRVRACLARRGPSASSMVRRSRFDMTGR
jgi:hypothetical protein